MYVCSTVAITLMLVGAIPSVAKVQTSVDLNKSDGLFVDTRIASGLHEPTAMEFSPDGRLIVAERGGNITIIKDASVLPAPFLSIPTDTSIYDRGLLGITLDPNFATNGYVYVYYTVHNSTDQQQAQPAHNRVSRFTANSTNPDRALAGSEKVLIDLDPLIPDVHNGGGLHFGQDGKLYIAVGDNDIGGNSQSLATNLGKMLRINPDGSIPADNPFYSVQGARKEIWALGLRNPFTFAFSPSSGKMYINDVGLESWEEINEGKAGANYGWPLCEGMCSNANFTNPIYAYPHNGTDHSITGGAFYEGTQFPEEYRGSYFYGDFSAGFIKRLTPNNEAVDFLQNVTSPVDIDVGPDGCLYYLSIGTGEVHRVQSGSFPITHMSDTSASGATSVYSGKHIDSEYVTSKSVLAGKRIDSITIQLSKAGSPTGTVQVGVFAKDLSVKKLFGTMDAAALTTTSTNYTFQLSNNELYKIKAGDYIGVKFTGGNSTNYVLAMRDANPANSFDGTRSFRAFHGSAG